jgi:hypothetical protein
MPLDHRSKLFDFTVFTALKAPRSKLPTRDSSKDSEYLRPLTQQWQILPTEIFERILDFLHADTQALISCSTVCHEWYPTSRYHLCTLLPVWPLALGQNCHKVNTAVALSMFLCSPSDSANIHCIPEQLETLYYMGRIMGYTCRTIVPWPRSSSCQQSLRSTPYRATTCCLFCLVREVQNTLTPP